jgi:pimeloyl-ACP methyl ester carboxylesterase
VKSSLALSSGTIATLDNGADSSAVAIFVPGYTGSKEDFTPLLRPLAAAGYRAIAVDQRGQYESSWASDPSGYEITALGADVAELATELRTDGTTIHLVGHSFGGLVTRSAVIAKPDLFDSFTLMGSGPAAIGGERRQWVDAMEPVLAQYGMSALWDRIALRSQADPKFLQSPPAVQRFLQTRFMANDPVGLTVMGHEIRTAEDRTDELVATGTALLVLHGIDDDAWPPAVQRTMAERLGAQYRVVSDAAHSPAVENPTGTLEALIEFWRALPSR